MLFLQNILQPGLPVVDLIEGTTLSKIIGGTLRLGEWECKLQKNTIAYDIYKKDTIWPRHRHRYEINSKYISQTCWWKLYLSQELIPKLT